MRDSVADIKFSWGEVLFEHFSYKQNFSLFTYINKIRNYHYLLLNSIVQAVL